MCTKIKKKMCGNHFPYNPYPIQKIITQHIPSYQQCLLVSNELYYIKEYCILACTDLWIVLNNNIMSVQLT